MVQLGTLYGCNAKLSFGKEAETTLVLFVGGNITKSVLKVSHTRSSERAIKLFYFWPQTV